ncbi:universal stress protein [Acidiferrimicrobium sp. IK]|uniref:universal stress protein n=1 Tax=Acidiferrimicrobium sp. IK TaxID=2871700 RepID=UPI0021CB8D22|nr:universal stress protein [Acidiferrimicrobium sp. IK]MCU4184474.1 universal stress protein [Acidiferrimicrobium sp. IK]
MRNGPVVVGVDGSPESVLALERAVELIESRPADARMGGASELVAVHVRANGALAYMAPGAGDKICDALDQVESSARRVTEDAVAGRRIRWDFVVRQGETARELTREAEARHAGVVVVGGHRHSAISSALVRSVDSAMVHTYDGTLMIVRPEPAPSGS